jgi:hypothetical protein
MPTPQFLTLDQVGAYTFYGVKVSTLGEDGDMGEVAFTHDRRRAIAATAALYRKEYGVRAKNVQILGGPQWWRIVDNCGCGTCTCLLDGDPDHGCTYFGLPPCLPDALAWLGIACADDAPGALPAIQLEVLP